MTMLKTSPYFYENYRRPRLVAGWLFACALMVFAMAMIGAITRLTESGLSITEWQPITGAWPPTSTLEWQHVFDLYRASPEYIHKNMGMTLAEFKQIYFWEWLHRLWGRAIGLVFFLPFLLFWLMAWAPARLSWRLFALLLLGAAQGFVGWFMVQSGLIDRPSVSHYRLAMHLTLALVLYGGLIWLALGVFGVTGSQDGTLPRGRASAWLKIHALMALLLLAATIIWGAFVAGLDAGLIYNEFPTMGEGRLIPKEMWHMTPAWLNLFENHASVQFTHRILAVLSVLMILSLATHALLTDVQGRVFPALAVMVLLQAGLGILTLISSVNLYAAALHQAGAMILLALLVTSLRTIFVLPQRDLGTN